MEDLVTDAGFWRGKRVLVTGHTGFKGGWLCLWLQQFGARVTGLALAPDKDASLFAAARVAESMTSIIGDVRDAGLVQAVVAEARPEIVFHMAAQALVRPSYISPVDTYMTNVMGTVHVLEAARQVVGARVVIAVTSDKCYENREQSAAYREDDPMGGHDPYSSSKGCAELVAAAYRRSFFSPDGLAEHGVALASARAGNAIGGGDWAQDRIVPDAMKSFFAGRPLEIRSPHSERPWQHVLEPLGGYLRLAEALWRDGDGFAGAWNFGPEGAETVANMAEMLCALYGGRAAWQDASGGVHPHEDRLLRLDCSKAHRLLGWRPRWTLRHALEMTVAWYLAARDGADMRAFTLEQIADYTVPAIADAAPL